MQKEQRLQEDRRSSRRTVLDAIAVLREYADFKERDRATMRLAPMRLPSHDIVTAVDLVFLPVSGGRQYSVALPTCKHFTGQPEGSLRREQFDISRLDEGVADFAGTVTLRDGLSLRWVEVLPVHLPYEPSETDWRIIHHTVAILHAEDRCYRWYGEGLPPELQAMVPPELKLIDCGRLSGLDLPPLKELTFQIRKKDPMFKKLSGQQIADTLRKFGMRLPKPRPRRK